MEYFSAIEKDSLLNLRSHLEMLTDSIGRWSRCDCLQRKYGKKAALESVPRDLESSRGRMGRGA